MTLRFIDKYEIVSTLGRGSMGVVYKAKDPEIGRLVAIKTLKSVFMGDDAAGNEALQRFRQESRSAGKLHHPNIVTIFEAGRTENGSPYIVMEYIEGKSMEAMIAEGGALDPLAVLHYLSQIASAIDYAHSQSVIHRDIKPSNIICDARHRPYLLDFGVAKLSDTSLTPAGTVVGTPSYMSPEQIRGSQLDGRTDLFSLAVVTFEAFTGQRPFPGTDFTTVVSNIIHKEPLSFGDVGANLPTELESVLHRGLAKEREQRFPNALSFINAAAGVFGVVVDGTGLAGGYTPGLKLPDAAAREAANRTRAATVVGSFQPGAESADAAGSPEEAQGHTTVFAQPVMTASTPLEEAATTAFPQPGYSNGATIQSSVPQSSGISKSSGASMSYDATPRKASAATKSKMPLAVVIVLLLGIGAGFVVRPDLLEMFGIHVSDDDEDNQSDDNGTVVDEPDAPPVKPAESKPTPEMVTKPAETPIVPVPTPVPTAVLTPVPAVKFVAPTVPPGGFTESGMAKLSDAEIGWLLSDENRDVESYKLALSEAGKRPKHELSLSLAEAAKHPDFKLRVDLLKVLARSTYHQKQPEIVQAITDLLRDREFIVRGFAVKTAATVMGADAIAPLETMLKTETNAVVLKVLNETLSQLRSGAQSQTR